MTLAYIDTSAAGKLLVDEPETAPLTAWLSKDAVEPCASYLLETELRRMATREGLPQQDVTGVLEGIALFEVPPSVFREAGLLAGAGLRSLDALHLASAVRLGVDMIVTYDQRLAESALDHGLRTLAPA